MTKREQARIETIKAEIAAGEYVTTYKFAVAVEGLMEDLHGRKEEA